MHKNQNMIKEFIMNRKIKTYPNPILLAKSQPVEEIDQTLRDELDEMVRIMVSHKGIGLAAPQIGISKRLITVMVNSQLYQVVNPKVAWQNGEQSDVEGCLSIPNEYYEVNRAKEIVLQGLNAEGKEICVLVENLLARVFQHEIDHLDGILINSKGKRYEYESEAELI
jgi:peptide deformylase